MEKIPYQRTMEFSSEDTGSLWFILCRLWRPLFCVVYSMSFVVFFILCPSFGIRCLTAGLVFSVFRQLGIVEVAVHVDFVRNCDDGIAKQNVPLGVIG